MELMKWNPMKELFNMRSRLDSMVDNFFMPMRNISTNEALWSWNPAVDIYENDDSIVVTAELPGVDKDQIAVDLQGRVLTLRGERASEQEVKEENYYRHERTHGRFERSFMLPTEVDPETVKAEYKDGVLNIRVPKPEEKKPKKISVH
ncbi:MAG: Hsp20/alpha crystallin family protein [Desulfobacteraceae bacterium]|nr:MAG: Hsp20/alpha crystallin family protein [Desulfobacteraceae bacterium]